MNMLEKLRRGEINAGSIIIALKQYDISDVRIALKEGFRKNATDCINDTYFSGADINSLEKESNMYVELADKIARNEEIEYDGIKIPA